jgi:lipoprotein NlpI
MLRKPYNWHAELLSNYAGRYEDGRKQFESHKTVNGNDVENAAGGTLCMARAKGSPRRAPRSLPIEGDVRVSQ